MVFEHLLGYYYPQHCIWQRQRYLRKKSIAAKQPHVINLEKQIDLNRSSSGISEMGNTQSEDR